jgi:predicted nucleic acid-binding protein
MSSALIDTNVLIYAADARSPAKQRLAVSLMDSLIGSRAGVISTQVLGEFFRVATNRLAGQLTQGEAFQRVEAHAALWQVLPVTQPVVLAAARGVITHGLSYWDAQLWATAKINGIHVVLSEDFQNGRVIEGVRFMNPFQPGFDLAATVAP